MSMKIPDGPLSVVFTGHRLRLAGAVLLFALTMTAGTVLLGLSGGFLTASALAGLAALGGGFNFFSPAAGIRALTIMRIVSRYFEKLLGHDATLRVARDLRVWFFARALPLAPGRLAASRTGELLARLMGDIGEVDGVFVRAIGPLLAMATVTVASLGAASWVYWPAAVLLALMALVIGCAVPWLAIARGRIGEDERASRRTQLRTLAFEGLEGAADLLAHHAQGRWVVQIDEAARRLSSADRRRRRRLLGAQLLHGLCAGAGLVAMLWLVLAGHVRHGLPAAWAASLVFGSVALLELWAGAGLAWQALLSGRVAAARLQQIVDQPPLVAGPAQPQALAGDAAATLEMRAVSFAWPGQGRHLLDGLDLRIEPGQRVAISGDSGSGKSTLSLLLLRQIDPEQGVISWAGHDLRTLALDQWHAQLAWLPQSAPVFAGSIAHNLRLGDPAASDAQLWASLEAVRLGDWARSQGGLEAWVGEDGATLSGGQARRLALARALLRPGALVVLDEPCEGLDVDTANALLGDLVAALAGRSLLMITHDALPAGVVDRHYRLQAGRLVAAALAAS